MSRYDSSLNSGTPANSALDSIQKLRRSVSSALSHPTEQLITQAGNSMAHTEQAVAQIEGNAGHGAVELAEELLGKEKERLSRLSSKPR